MNNKTILGSLIALVIGTACCWVPMLIVLFGGTVGATAMASGLNTISIPFILLGVGLMSYGFYKTKEKNKPMEIILDSKITCPACSHAKEETMPTNACAYFYECENCNVVLKPLKGDCCVYCSYGTVKCPPIQEGNACC